MDGTLANPKDRASYDAFTDVTLRFSDQDSLGHVNNVAYAAFFEAGRVALLADMLPETLELGLDFVLARVEIDYLREVHFPGTMEVGGRLLRIGRTSITTGYGAFVNGECCALSTSVNVFFDPKTRRPAEPPQRLRAAMLARLGG